MKKAVTHQFANTYVPQACHLLDFELASTLERTLTEVIYIVMSKG